MEGQEPDTRLEEESGVSWSGPGKAHPRSIGVWWPSLLKIWGDCCPGRLWGTRPTSCLRRPVGKTLSQGRGPFQSPARPWGWAPRRAYKSRGLPGGVPLGLGKKSRGRGQGETLQGCIWRAVPAVLGAQVCAGGCSHVGDRRWPHLPGAGARGVALRGVSCPPSAQSPVCGQNSDQRCSPRLCLYG